MEDAEESKKNALLACTQAGVPVDTTECLENLDFSASQRLGGEESVHVRNRNRF